MHILCEFGPVSRNTYCQIGSISSPAGPNDLENVGQGQPKLNQVWSPTRCIFCANLVQFRGILFELSRYNCQIGSILSPAEPYDLEMYVRVTNNQVSSPVRCIFCANLVQIRAKLFWVIMLQPPIYENSKSKMAKWPWKCRSWSPII